MSSSHRVVFCFGTVRQSEHTPLDSCKSIQLSLSGYRWDSIRNGLSQLTQMLQDDGETQGLEVLSFSLPRDHMAVSTCDHNSFLSTELPDPPGGPHTRSKARAVRWGGINGFPSGESSLRHHVEFQRITWKHMDLDKPRAAGDTMQMNIIWHGRLGYYVFYFFGVNVEKWNCGVMSWLTFYCCDGTT